MAKSFLKNKSSLFYHIFKGFTRVRTKIVKNNVEKEKKEKWAGA